MRRWMLLYIVSPGYTASSRGLLSASAQRLLTRPTRRRAAPTTSLCLEARDSLVEGTLCVGRKVGRGRAPYPWRMEDGGRRGSGVKRERLLHGTRAESAEGPNA